LISANMQFTPSSRNASCFASIEGVDVALVGERHATRDVVDVAAAVAVLGRRVALVRRDERTREAVDLRAVVVEVVLAGDLRALALQDAGERVADGGPAGAAEVDGPVGLAETNSRLMISSARCRSCRTPRPPRRSSWRGRRRRRHPAGC
jgi:hypothetical protein